MSLKVIKRHVICEFISISCTARQTTLIGVSNLGKNFWVRDVDL